MSNRYVVLPWSRYHNLDQDGGARTFYSRAGALWYAAEAQDEILCLSPTLARQAVEAFNDMCAAAWMPNQSPEEREENDRVFQRAQAILDAIRAVDQTEIAQPPHLVAVNREFSGFALTADAAQIIKLFEEDEWLPGESTIKVEPGKPLLYLESKYRDHPAVIAAVDMLREAAAYRHAVLALVEVPARATDWRIENDGGYERVLAVVDGKIVECEPVWEMAH